jgi:DNA helicase IV
VNNKEETFFRATGHVQKVVLHVEKEGERTERDLAESKEVFKTLSAEDQLVEIRMMAYRKKRINELGVLRDSPYFVRCDVVWEGSAGAESIYFAKFSFDKEAIYSWITPASAMRFENPGEVRYVRPDGNVQKAQMVRKDQYMIVGGKIKFLATEALGRPRELVYQEYFSKRKTGFMLPEIVAQMEKAQDQVIRAHHSGPFLISGPAGSGKTTLALHRVAYLTQSPDLSEIYKSRSIIVFVQDSGTKEYFSHLLPELGIDDVLITTFSEWALSILGIDAEYAVRFGDTEETRDRYEFAKLRALRSAQRIAYRKGSAFAILEGVYAEVFDDTQKDMFTGQKSKRVLDRIDLTLLLRAYARGNGSIGVVQDVYAPTKRGGERKKRTFVPFEYSLMVVDEFQNYLPEQLRLMNSCVNKKNRSILYVGDMAQQVQWGTIRHWEEIGEAITQERRALLCKVYRNTKNILRYIEGLGYPVEIPDGAKDGVDVVEKITATVQEEIRFVQASLEGKDYGSVGILAKDPQYLSEFKDVFAKNAKVHVMTMQESQGVEFDAVYIVGISRETFQFSAQKEGLGDFEREREKINRDLLYVAMTRAISELSIVGTESLKKIFG